MNQNTPIVIIGFGNQAKAWALNLRDSGREVCILLRDNSPSTELVEGLGFKTLSFNEQLKDFHDFVVLTPDHTHAEILKELEQKIPKESKLIFAHGYSYIKDNFKDLYPQWNLLMLAPKAIASEVRFQYQTKGKLGAVFSLEGQNENQEAWLMELAKALGITSGPHQTSFKDECFADLFSEQSLLCGLLPYAALKSFNLLRAKGISPEVAYMECWLEVKLIADAMVKKGPLEFFKLISPNALIGGEKAREMLFDKAYQNKIERLWNDIESGSFFKEIDQSDFSQKKNQVLEFWKGQELSKVHDNLIGDLISESQKT